MHGPVNMASYMACVLPNSAVCPAAIGGTANVAHACDAFEEHRGFVCRHIPAASCMLSSNAHAHALCVYAGPGAIPPTTSSQDSGSNTGLGWTTCLCCTLPRAKYALGPDISCCKLRYESKASDHTCRKSTFQQKIWHNLYKPA